MSRVFRRRVGLPRKPAASETDTGIQGQPRRLPILERGRGTLILWLTVYANCRTLFDGAEDARSVFTTLLSRRTGWQAEYRPDLATKNLLATGAVSAAQVIEMLSCCTESQYECYPHLDDNRTLVHDFRPNWSGKGWIVKCYILSGIGMFISVHPLK